MIDGIIVGRDNWKKVYRSKVNNCNKKAWIMCLLSDGTEIFSAEDNKVNLFKEYCTRFEKNIDKIGVKYRSHEVWLDEEIKDGCYIVKSIKGYMNESPKHCIVLGVIDGNVVRKKAYMTPELIVSYEDDDEVEKCFAEALIYNDKEKTASIQ